MSLFMSSNCKCDSAHALLQIRKQYCISETTQNEYIYIKTYILHSDEVRGDLFGPPRMQLTPAAVKKSKFWKRDHLKARNSHRRAIHTDFIEQFTSSNYQCDTIHVI